MASLRGSDLRWEKALVRYHRLPQDQRRIAGEIYELARKALQDKDGKGGVLVKWDEFALAMENAVQYALDNSRSQALKAAADEYDEAMRAEDIMEELQ
jgi:hypothetical protein